MLLSERLPRVAAFHEPEIALEPVGPGATRVSVPLPTTGSALVFVLLLNSTVSVLPSGEAVSF